MERDAKIYVAGHGGLVGSAITRALRSAGYQNLVVRRSREMDLRRQAEVEVFFERERPEYVFIAAARVGGIVANRDNPVEFLADNAQMELNLIQNAARTGVKKLLFLGSSCVYPKFAPQPMKESALLSSSLEPTNEPYAIAKIMGLKLTEYYWRAKGMNFISVMPPNMYGPFDNFDPENSHVIPGLMRRFHEAKIARAPTVTVWGTGEPLREFLYSEDLADGLIFLMKNFSEPGFINLGSGEEVTIRQLVELLAEVVGYQGSFHFDTSRPDGTPRKVMDSTRIRALGWKPKTSLREGLRKMYEWYLENGAAPVR
jgi:GDP-L-fucose synthase